jgi:hypothetical protein
VVSTSFHRILTTNTSLWIDFLTFSRPYCILAVAMLVAADMEEEEVVVPMEVAVARL